MTERLRALANSSFATSWAARRLRKAGAVLELLGAGCSEAASAEADEAVGGAAEDALATCGAGGGAVVDDEAEELDATPAEEEGET